ncbi:MAG: sigma-70 family RNA polymerase sigma factor [Patescibacteria group bacterium]
MTQKEEVKEEVQLQTILTIAHFDFKRGLNSHAFFKIQDRAISEDLVQSTFMKTWRYLVRGGKINLMKAFLYHVLNDLIVDEYRKKKNKMISLNILSEKGFEPSNDDSENLFNILDGRAALLLIRYLPEKYQRVMRMRYVQLLSLREISLITGQSKNTVAVQAHRGISKLRLLYHRTEPLPI